MEKHWIDILRRRFADRQVPPPEGLWPGVEAALASRRARRARYLLLWRVVSVAACVALVVAVGWHFAGGDGLGGHAVAPSAGRAGQGPSASLADSPVPVGHGAGHGLVARVAGAVHGLAAGRGHNAADTAVQVAAMEPVAPAVGGGEEAGGHPVGGSVDAARRVDNAPRSGGHASQGDLLAIADVKGGGGSRVAVSVYGTGLSVFGNGSGSSPSSLMPYYAAQDVALEPDFRMLSALYANPAGQSEVNVKHRQPVRVGASVRFGLSRRLSLETGVNYSYHSSDISSGDEDSGYKTEQKLHFVGVPLSVSCNVWRNDVLEVYLSAGGAVDFCVSGDAHTEYVSDRAVVRTADEDVRDGRPQWSVNAAAGVQYDFTPFVGLYLEPGVSYYFDNGSSVKTIYKDKPFNFNLNVGLRMTFGK